MTDTKTKASEYTSSKVWEIDYRADSDVQEAFEAGALWALEEVERLAEQRRFYKDTGEEEETLYLDWVVLKEIIQKIRGE